MYIKRLLLFVFAFLTLTGTSIGQEQELGYKPKILLVTAHPDDDAIYSATVFKTTHLLDGVADLAIMTNGEGGYKYSTLGNYIYGRELDREEVGRAYLPGIRKKEVMAGGRIVGIRNYYFLDRVDDEFSLDVERPLQKWDTEWIVDRLRKVMRDEQYDFVFTMMPSKDTHAHHKASALLALRALQGLDKETRPIAMSTTILGSEEDSTNYTMLEGYPITRINRDINPFTFDRNQTFGYDDRLNYNIIANWVIAEHKSQGTMQLFMGAGVIEQYWYYSLNDPERVGKVHEFFKAVNEVPIYLPGEQKTGG